MKKKICMVLPTHYTAFMGGAQYQAKCILDGLVQTNKYEIHYLTRRVNSIFKPIGYEIHRISKGDQVNRMGFYVDCFRLYKLLKEINPDVIYQRVAGPYTGITAYFAKRNNCKMIWHVAHTADVTPDENVASNNIILKYFDRKFIEYGLRNATYIVAQTEEQSQLMIKYYGRISDKIIPNFHPFPTGDINKDEIITVVWIANFKSWKQPEIFIQLAKDLLDLEGVQFVMVGAFQGGSQAWHEKLKSDISLLKNLEHVGKKDQDDVNKLLSSAHIFVNTSLHEGFANTFIQAWLRKVPVVSLHVNPDNLLERFGIGIYAGTYKKLQESIRSLALDHERRKIMGANAVSYAQEYHSFKNINLLIELIER